MDNLTSTLASLPSPSTIFSHLPVALQSSLSSLLELSPTGYHSAASWKTYVISLGIGYLALCRALRFRREKSLRKRYGFPDRASLARMTVNDAQKIIKELSTLEFPYFLVTSLQFGLFKTYGVESISKLLLATKNLTDPVASLKRYEDTAVLIGEFTANPPNSERAAAGIARMNWLHSRYPDQISNADLLYTLSVFITEPERFTRLYEWRPFNEMEFCAYGVFWKSIGDAMGIKYEGFLSKTEWKDGLEFAADIAQWAKSYEVVAFKPSPIANKPATALIPMITYWVPKSGQAFARECVNVLLGDRVREAFMLPEPGIVAAATVYTSLNLRRFYMRYLTLPRFIPLNRHAGGTDSKDARMNIAFSYGNYPFYVKPTFWNRWGPEAWVIWLAGGKLPGDAPGEFMAEGYTFPDLGPRDIMGMGKEAMEADIVRIKGMGMGGCPFG